MLDSASCVSFRDPFVKIGLVPVHWVHVLNCPNLVGSSPERSSAIFTLSRYNVFRSSEFLLADEQAI